MYPVCGPSVTQQKADTAGTKMLFTPAFWNSPFGMTRSWRGGPGAWNQEAEFWQYLSVWFLATPRDSGFLTWETALIEEFSKATQTHTHARQILNKPMFTKLNRLTLNSHTPYWIKKWQWVLLRKVHNQNSDDKIMLPDLLYALVPRSTFYTGINGNLERVTQRVSEIFEVGLLKKNASED